MTVGEDASLALQQLRKTGFMSGGTFVVGCSTSEVAGERIGTAGSEEIASELFRELVAFSGKTGMALAFQCCEHLNRAVVVERSTAERHRGRIVAAVPVREAGGSMAAHAYRQMEDPVLIESIDADAGLDIGETLIGMQLKRVAVPLRIHQKYIGQARITAARTRPPLIGGPRAVYE